MAAIQKDGGGKRIRKILKYGRSPKGQGASRLSGSKTTSSKLKKKKDEKSEEAFGDRIKYGTRVLHAEEGCPSLTTSIQREEKPEKERSCLRKGVKTSREAG